MHRHDQTPVFRYDKPLHGLRLAVSGVRTDQQITLSITAAGRPHRLHKNRVQFVDHGAQLLRTRSPLHLAVPQSRFIHGLKQKGFVIVAKAPRNLLPDHGKLRPYLLRPFCSQIQPLFMMQIDDHIQIRSKRHVDYLLHPVHPDLRNLIRSIQVILPCYRDPHRAKPCLLHRQKGFRIRFRVSPVRLVLQIVRIRSVFPKPRSIQRVSQIDSRAHLTDKTECPRPAGKHKNRDCQAKKNCQTTKTDRHLFLHVPSSSNTAFI